MDKRFPRDCPECGCDLVVRHGSFGEFVGCESWPVCTYTKNISKPPEYERIDENTWRIKTEKKTCPFDKCDGTSLIPLKRKSDDSIVPYAFTYCECHEEKEHYIPIRPEDFDFPMSYDYYRSLCQYHGWQDPGPDTLPELPKEIERPMVRRLDWQQQVEAERIDVRKKLAKALLEIDKLNAKVGRTTKGTYSII